MNDIKERNVRGVGIVKFVSKEDKPDLIQVLPEIECRCGCGQRLDGFAVFPPNYSILTTKECFKAGRIDKVLRAAIKE